MSEMPQKNPSLEPSGKRRGNQPGGVSEDPRNDGWGHRTEMEMVDTEKRRSVSQRVNERRGGEVVRLKREEKQDWETSDGSNSGDDQLVDEGKSKKEKLAEKWGDKVSDEMKRKLRQKRIEEAAAEADEILNE